MSTASKVTFGLCCTASVGIIGYVHYKQAYDREQLHLGVIRDIERRERRKAENVYVLQQQAELAKELRRGITTIGDKNT
ncbi:protein PET117 homolog, mitochondrial [Cataglyphis hispanica]|uniref:protein PET117 homolog, mitochondrial n=1 Tax=Cataglyphis hispanica TaxID=1086592 RepID=UPI00217FB376|nr:protein PET117 homolog, mitochondrial [Cataglyphis hispanica]